MRSLERGAILLGKYRVDSVIGRGGMGVVVKAWHLALGEQVAIKMLRDDVVIADEAIARFVREAQAAVRLKSEHIARILDVGTFDDGKPYMVMEYLEGQDIAQLIAERGWLQPSLAIDLVIQACDALAEAHSLGIVHRDIKPTNLFLTSRPDGTVLLKVLDFGISKAPGPELSITQTWSVLGSPAYMSPEQMRSARNVDARTDIWSLGAVLYEALEGHLPFQAGSFSEMCVMVAVDPPTPTTETPRELVPIISRCLAKTPEGRYPNVAELARDLAQHAREPDRARAIVDGIFRTLGRTRVRTPPVGVPLVALPNLDPMAPGLAARPPTHPHPMPARRPPTPTPTRSAYRNPFGDLPNGFTPASLAAGTPRALENSAASSQPAYAAAVSRAATSALAGFAPALPQPPPRPPEATPASGLPSASDPFAAQALADLRLTPPPQVPMAPSAAAPMPMAMPMPMPMPRAASEAGPPEAPIARPSSPQYPGLDPQSTTGPTPRYSPYPLPLPQPLHGEQPYLRPGLKLPRGASEDLTVTHVITRPVSTWIVAAIAIAVGLAAALAIVAVTRGSSSQTSDGAAPVVRMNPTSAPTVSPIEPGAPDSPDSK